MSWGTPILARNSRNALSKRNWPESQHGEASPFTMLDYKHFGMIAR